MIIFHGCCCLKYPLLTSPYSLGLLDLRAQCLAVHSIYTFFKYVQIRLWLFWVFIAPLVEALFKYVIMLCPLNVDLLLNRFVNVTVVY